MAGPAVGLWLFKAGSFEDTCLKVLPRLETFCEATETGGNAPAFEVRDVKPLGMQTVDLSFDGVLGYSSPRDEARVASELSCAREW